MPIIDSQFEVRNRMFRNTHFSTIYASLLRQLPRIPFIRERLETPDGDFLDLDWLKKGGSKLVVILPGLEGKSQSRYSKAAIRYFNRKGWDALGLNYRGCSGEPNRLLRGYHMGASDDVKLVIEYTLQKHDYQEIVLIGYSLGGNLALKYAGEEGLNIPKAVKSVISFSAPMDIQKSDERLNEWYNWHYLKWFMFPLNRKANRKKRQFPEALKNYHGFFMSGNFVYFDTNFTAPANGYKTVQDYWKDSSCQRHLVNISIPTLVVSSLNDTFISKNCYPLEAAQQNPNIFLEMPKHGGHCGFIQGFFEKESWMEKRAFRFLEEQIK